MADYIPKDDADLNIWQGNLLTTIELNASQWGIPQNDLAIIKSFQNIWTSAFARLQTHKSITVADIMAKEIASLKLKKAIRPFIAEWVAENKKISDTDLARMGLDIYSNARKLIPAPTSAPIGVVDFATPCKHFIHFCDQLSAFQMAKPAGVIGCEVYMKVGGNAPHEISELAFKGVCTGSPFEIKFESKNSGSFVYYWLRWVNKYNEYGPWSETISSIVR